MPKIYLTNTHQVRLEMSSTAIHWVVLSQHIFCGVAAHRYIMKMYVHLHPSLPCILLLDKLLEKKVIYR